jgi:glycosyltransferase involved in cell wall biosynthesis
MEKIHVLVLPSDRTGVGKFRSVEPHIFLQNLYPDEFHVDIDYDPKMDDMNYWKKYQIVHFHRTLNPDYEKSNAVIQKLNNAGIITILDIDDYWLPTKEHPAHQLVIQNNLFEKIKNNIKVAKYVTTTTSLFAHEISKLNKNVFVIPNSINPEESQFKEPTIPSDKLRFGWLGGSSHLHDLELFGNTFERLKSYQDKIQLYLCGFDTRGSMTEINAQTGEQKSRPIKPLETVWYRYEQIVTTNHSMMSADYKEFLMKFKEDNSVNFPDEYYQRVWTRPVTSYAKNYSKFDVSLAPIKNHIFNKVKSQLKVIEAGFYKKAIIASDFGPYTVDLKSAYVNKKFTNGNALLVNEFKNYNDWYKNIKLLSDNPNMAYDLGQKLYETVKDTYDLRVVTKNRAELYKSLLK